MGCAASSDLECLPLQLRGEHGDRWKLRRSLGSELLEVLPLPRRLDPSVVHQHQLSRPELMRKPSLAMATTATSVGAHARAGIVEKNNREERRKKRRPPCCRMAACRC